jgi:hypothetical protein
MSLKEEELREENVFPFNAGLIRIVSLGCAEPTRASNKFSVLLPLYRRKPVVRILR